MEHLLGSTVLGMIVRSAGRAVKGTCRTLIDGALRCKMVRRARPQWRRFGMQRYDLSRILIVDLEATCWDGEPPSGQTGEIIEIGVALLSTDDGTIERGPEIIVRPTSSVVSEFCEQLTGISQRMVDERGVDFAAAIDLLIQQYGDSRLAWASFGDYDRHMLANACHRHGITYPLSDTHINVKRIEAILNGYKETGMMRCLKRMGLDLAEGTQHHRGGDDALNIARILWEIIRRYRSSTASG